MQVVLDNGIIVLEVNTPDDTLKSYPLHNRKVVIFDVVNEPNACGGTFYGVLCYFFLYLCGQYFHVTWVIEVFLGDVTFNALGLLCLFVTHLKLYILDLRPTNSLILVSCGSTS